MHILTNVHSETAIFVKISEAKMNDEKVFAHLTPEKDSMLGFVKA